MDWSPHETAACSLRTYYWPFSSSSIALWAIKKEHNASELRCCIISYSFLHINGTASLVGFVSRCFVGFYKILNIFVVYKKEMQLLFNYRTPNSLQTLFRRLIVTHLVKKCPTCCVIRFITMFTRAHYLNLPWVRSMHAACLTNHTVTDFITNWSKYTVESLYWGVDICSSFQKIRRFVETRY